MKFSGFSFLDVYTDLTKNQQNSRRSGRKGWLISHGMTLLFSVTFYVHRVICSILKADVRK